MVRTAMESDDKALQEQLEELDIVTIRFAGDSGDGMQLTGTEFTNNTALVGNDLATFPDYPSEIRAPAGSLAGVSSYQIQFSKYDIHTPGDDLDVLVAMNPAALKVHLKDLKDNGIVLINKANFNARNLKLADWESNPLEDDTLKGYRVVAEDMSKLVQNSVKDLNLPPKIVTRSTNMFALGFLYYLYDRTPDSTIRFLESKFAKRPEIIQANSRALKAGYYYGSTVRAVKTHYRVDRAKLAKGVYRNVMGNQAISFGLLAAAVKSGLDLYYGGYPITPASDILHYLAAYKHFGVKTFQAEDEIAGVVSTIGAAFAGDLAVTATSGPGMALKTEALGLAVSTELPIVVINVQRAGPSTGIPTKTEQSDLFQSIYGRNGETPIVVLAASTPGDCFNTAFEACKIALEHMIPVILLTDGYLGNGSEPWLLPDVDALPVIKTRKTTTVEDFEPFRHDPETLARPWAIPGTPGLEHRVGGLEKADGRGNVNYEPENHQKMTELRQKKVDIVAEKIPLAEAYGSNSGNLLVVGWGGTFGALRSAVERGRKKGQSVAHLHLRHLNPFPKNLGDVLNAFDQILVAELNMGQLQFILQGTYLVKTEGLHKVMGRPFSTGEITAKIDEMLEGK